MIRDYSLVGETSQLAETNDLSNAKWYRTKIDPKLLVALRKKSDLIPLRDTVIWLGLMVVSGAIAVWLWPSWWSLPFWVVYGVLYGSASDSRWHECGHKTAFKTAWLNDSVYHIASFMLMRNPVTWRASHIRHHTDTIIVGRDPEIIAMRPPDLIRIILNLFGIVDGYNLLKRMLKHACGQLHEEERTYVNQEDHRKVFHIARIWLAIYLSIIVLSVWTYSILPLMLVGLPKFYGAWHHVLTGILQHLGLAEDVNDHRLNTRTVLMNPISRFIYWNMNYHIEHHMFTMIPYYHLPKLHELIKHDLPEPEPSMIAAFRKLIPVLVKQLKYHDAVIVPALPNGATPYADEVKRLLPHAV